MRPARDPSSQSQTAKLAAISAQVTTGARRVGTLSKSGSTRSDVVAEQLAQLGERGEHPALHGAERYPEPFGELRL